MKNILILADTNLETDGRIRRHIFAIKDKYNVIVTGIKNPNIANVKFINCSKENISKEELEIRKKLLRDRMANCKFEEAYWGEAYIDKLYSTLRNIEIDIILANDISMVPLGVRLAKEKNAKVIADMHEYAPKEFEDIAEWRTLFQDYKYYLCKNYLPKCDEVITVSKGIADEYNKEFNVITSVLTNAPKYREIKIKQTNEKIRMVYHGDAHSSRNLDALIEVIENLDDRFSQDFYLVGNKNDTYFKNLLNKIEDTPRCYFKNPVNPEQIVDMLHEYDIGIYLLKPINFNNEYALPNKFFEFAQARLAIAVGPLHEMKYYIEKFNCGLVSENFESKSLVRLINNLTTKEIDILKSNSDKLAKVENAEKNSKLLIELIESLQ